MDTFCCNIYYYYYYNSDDVDDEDEPDFKDDNEDIVNVNNTEFMFVFKNVYVNVLLYN